MRVEAIDLGYLDLDRAALAFLVDLREDGGEPILVECGPAACVERLRAGLRSRGVEPSSIRTVLVTHIHLDHAGAAGHFARDGATISVHPFGAKHLLDPAKLIASSRRVHGASYDRFYGDLLACPAARVAAVPSGTSFRCGRATISAHETPGHARHHHAWSIESAGRRVVFTGDVAAMIVPGSRFVSVPTPPPEFDVEAWRQSLDTLARLEATEFWLTHGGLVADPRSHLESVRSRLEEEFAFAAETIRSDVPEQAAIDRYQEWLWPRAAAGGVDLGKLRAFVGPAFCRMNLNGMRRALGRA